MDFKKKMPDNVEALVNLYNETASGYFFSKDTMRFFKSKLTGYYRRVDDNTALFVTTEKGPSETSRRKASVRIARMVHFKRENEDMVSKVSIETLGDFNRMSVPIAVKVMNAWENLYKQSDIGAMGL